jgi:hypothetical protein
MYWNNCISTPIPNPMCISTTPIVIDNPTYNVHLAYKSQQHNTVDIASTRSTLWITAQVGRDTDTKLYT